MMQLFLANHLNPPSKATFLLILYREVFFSVGWFSEKTKIINFSKLQLKFLLGK